MSMSLNSVKTNTMAPFISSQIDSKLKRALNLNAITKYDQITLFKADTTGIVIPVPKADEVAINVFTSTFTPVLSPASSGLWTVILDPAKDDFARMRYTGKPTQVYVETVFRGHTNTETAILTAQLYLNGNAIDADLTGGRGFDSSTTAVVSGSTGTGAILLPTVVEGNITGIAVVKQGSSYGADAKVVITGHGKDATAEVSIAGGSGAITAVTLTATKICAEGMGIQFSPAGGSSEGSTANYIFDLITNDILDLRVRSTKSGGGTLASSKAYMASIAVRTNVISYT